MKRRTRKLHDAIDASIRKHGHPYLHPGGETIQLDLFGTGEMIGWQDEKAARTFLGGSCWSELPQIYGRYGSEHGRRLLGELRELESAAAAVVTDSGMSACALVIDTLFVPGATAVVSAGIYNKTRAYLARAADRMGGEVRILPEPVRGDHLEPLRNRPGFLFVETYTNPLMRAVDVSALVRAASEIKATNPSARLIVDNTIATPWGTRAPLLDSGVDIVVASGTKALDGRDQNMWGYVASNDVRTMNEMMDVQAMRGGGLDWRRAKTIAGTLGRARRRFERRCRSASYVAAFLDSEPAIEAVFHPSLPHHPDAGVIAAQYRLPGSVVSFKLTDADEAATRHFCDVVAMTGVARYALSFDGVVTKINHHRSVSEYHATDAEADALGVSRLVRLGVGLEDASDLVRCLEWALRYARQITSGEVDQWRRARRAELGLEPEGGTG